MTTSPADTTEVNMTNQDFGNRLKELVKGHNNLMKLASKVYALKKTERLTFANGEEIGRQELRTMSSAYSKELRSLKKNYTAHGKRKKRVRNCDDKDQGGQLGNPVFANDNLRNFIANGNFGADPRYPGSQPINQLLAVTEYGVINRSLLTPLFDLYAHVNNMQQFERKDYLAPTADMQRYFADTFRFLANREPRVSADGKPIEQFNPTKFKYNALTSIANANVIKSPQWSAEQRAIAENPQTALRLKEEQNLVSGSLLYYRLNDKAPTLGKVRSEAKKLYQKCKINEELPKNLNRDQAIEWILQRAYLNETA